MHADAIDAVMSTKKAASMGQFDLFGSMDGTGSSELDSVFDVKVPAEEWDPKHRLAVEREMLGLYVSGHPLHGVEQVLTAKSDTSIATILDGVPAPEYEEGAVLQAHVTNLDASPYVGRLALCRVLQGTMRPDQIISLFDFGAPVGFRLATRHPERYGLDAIYPAFFLALMPAATRYVPGFLGRSLRLRRRRAHRPREPVPPPPPGGLGRLVRRRAALEPRPRGPRRSARTDRPRSPSARTARIRAPWRAAVAWPHSVIVRRRRRAMIRGAPR